MALDCSETIACQHMAFCSARAQISALQKFEQDLKSAMSTVMFGFLASGCLKQFKPERLYISLSGPSARDQIGAHRC